MALIGKGPDGEGTAMVVLKVLGGLVGLGFAVFSAVQGYYALMDRMTRIDNAVATQGKTLESFAATMQKLADQALTEADLRMFCLQAQILNTKWVCPYANEPGQVVRNRRVRTMAVTTAPPSAPGVGAPGR